METNKATSLYEGTKVSTLRGPAQLADLQGALCVPTFNFTLSYYYMTALYYAVGRTNEHELLLTGWVGHSKTTRLVSERRVCLYSGVPGGSNICRVAIERGSLRDFQNPAWDRLFV